MLSHATIDGRIHIPFGGKVQGPPMSGKTHFTMNLIKNSDRIFDKPIDYVFWFYGQRNKTIDEIESDKNTNIVPVQGLPENIEDFIESRDKNGEKRFALFVFDDLMADVSNNKSLTDLTSKKCQHHSVSWLILMQNMFYHGSERITLL